MTADDFKYVTFHFEFDYAFQQEGVDLYFFDAPAEGSVEIPPADVIDDRGGVVVYQDEKGKVITRAAENEDLTTEEEDRGALFYDWTSIVEERNDWWEREEPEKPVDPRLQEQLDIAERVLAEDNFLTPLTHVGGLDISFSKEDPTKVCAALVVTDLEGKEVYATTLKGGIIEKYQSGFLAYRELPLYTDIVKHMQKECPPDLQPQILMVDGGGVLHHRGAGSASHLGVNYDYPTIGVAKTLLSLDGLDENKIRQQMTLQCPEKGDFLELKGTTGKLYGVAVNSGSVKPVYVSVGHRVSLETARKLVVSLSRYRIPEPIRLADIQSKVPLRSERLSA